jgi:anaerobic ribonucleoside-triphosphate reductase activating protein
VRIAINKAHFPVTVLGPGRRIGLWLQGCSIRCAGCVSRDTWERDAAREMPLATLLDWCRGVAAGGFDGVTVSGGEPFDQPHALRALLRAFVEWRARERLGFDLLCYSGYPLRTLERRHASILRLLDAVVPEPYVQSRPTRLRWRGSENQPIVPLTALGRSRYADAMAEGKAELQFRVDAERIWYIGIPRAGDLERIEARCRAQGLSFENVSWRP